MILYFDCPGSLGEPCTCGGSGVVTLDLSVIACNLAVGGALCAAWWSGYDHGVESVDGKLRWWPGCGVPL